MKYFVIADTHFYDENIIRFCNRPFKNVDEMNKVMVDRWNSVVGHQDIVLHLGDFCSGSLEQCKKIATQLNGIIYLIRGNHDRFDPDVYKEVCGMSYVSEFPIIYKNFYMLSHEPLLLSNTTPYFSFYGHIHNDSKFQDDLTSKCVSVERINYTPFCFLEEA